MTTIISDEIAQEESSFAVTCTMTDEAGSAVPDASISSLKWSLLTRDGEVVNGRDAVEISPPTGTYTISLSGTDLATVEGETTTPFHYVWRVLLVEAVYDSDVGSGLYFKDEIHFRIGNLIGVPRSTETTTPLSYYPPEHEIDDLSIRFRNPDGTWGEWLTFSDHIDVSLAAAQASEDKAQAWAENPEDVEVETGQYSSLHHAAKASGFSTTAEGWADKAELWANEAEDVEVEVGLYSAKHFVAKAEDEKTAAEAWADKAELWANEAEDTEVEVGLYSALHYAAKAAASAAEAEADKNAINTYQAVTASTASTTIDFASGLAVVVALQADTEITLSNVPYPASGRITFEQDVVGGWGVTWADEILWLNSTPTIGSAAFGRYVVRWWTDEDAQVYAEYAGDIFEDQSKVVSGETYVRLATIDGGAMCFMEGVDLSSYAGTDSGDTPFKLTFTDSGGLTAVAYAGAAGGGETYDVELFDNAGLEDGIENWSAFDATISQDASVFRSGAYSVKAVASADQGRAVRVFADLSTGSLYNCSGYVKNVAGGQSRITFSSYISSPPYGDYSAAFQFSYVIFNATSSVLIVRVVNRYLGGVAYGDDFSLKKFTDVAETGLHLISSPNGTTRNMASIETGFDPNAITEIDIERVD